MQAEYPSWKCSEDEDSMQEPERGLRVEKGGCIRRGCDPRVWVCVRNQCTGEG